MPRSETITLYKARKEGLASTRIGHVEKEYDLLSDEVSEDGVRIIKVKPKDLSERAKMQNEVVDSLMKKLGETSRTLKAILSDTMKDYSEATIKRLHKKVVSGEKPIRRGRGCYYISIGDGRKKGRDIIRIRD